MGLSEAIEQIATVVRFSPGVVFTPDAPPTQLSDFEFPAAIIYPISGSGELATANGGNGLPVEQRSITLRLDLHVRTLGEDLDEATILAISASEPLSKTLWRGFLNNRFGGTIAWMGSETTSPIRWTYGIMSWGGQDTIGFTYELDVTLMEDIP